MKIFPSNTNTQKRRKKIVCAMRSGQGGGAANESFVIDHLWA
jgi:hypothetical protein